MEKNLYFCFLDIDQGVDFGRVHRFFCLTVTLDGIVTLLPQSLPFHRQAKNTQIQRMRICREMSVLAGIICTLPLSHYYCWLEKKKKESKGQTLPQKSFILNL